MDKAQSSTVGGIAGGVAGSFLPIPGGTAIGMAAGTLVGGLFGKSPSAPPLPPMVDPMAQQMLDDLYAKRRGIEMGTSTEFQTAREIIQRSEASALSDVAKITGGDVGGAVAASERIMEAGGNNISKVVGQATEMATPYTQMINDLMAKMSQRKLELQMASHLQGLATKTQAKEDLNANLSNVFSSSALWDTIGQSSNVSSWVQGLFGKQSEEGYSNGEMVVGYGNSGASGSGGYETLDFSGK